MKALQKLQLGDGYVEFTDVPEPSIQRGKVKIKVEAVGICGTDIKIRAGQNFCRPPVTLGHEYSGTVVEIGEGVTSIAVGDAVTSETANVICGTCYYCRTGDYLMCPDRLSIGYGVDGAMTSYIVVREAIVHKLPEGLSFDEAAMCEPLAVAIHAVFDNAALLPTDTVVVIGPGAIGQLVAQVAGSTGARVLVAGTTKDSERLKIAKELKAYDTFDVLSGDPVDWVLRNSGGYGADYVFECSGAVKAVDMGLNMLKKKGTLVQVGLTPENFDVPYKILTSNEVSIKGVFGHNWMSWRNALIMLERKSVDVKPLITHKFPLPEWEKAFSMMENMEGIKIILHPHED